ncbi:MAG: DUF3575 domain-containing protein [Bacteroidetes bacterium]|nr:MAG: DUF3575 domain-containing protein [Bacteroidota bacterium]
MKNLSLVVLISFFSLSLFAQSNVKVGYQGVNYPHSGETFFGPSVAVEAALKNSFSLHLNVAYLTDHEVIAVDSDVITRGLKFEPELRFYPRKELKGFFLGARTSYTNFSSILKTGKDKVDFPTWGGEEAIFGYGGVIGYQANFSENLIISTVLGLEVESKFSEAMGSVGVSLGYRF